MKKISKRNELYIAVKMGENISLPINYIRHFGLFGRLVLLYPRLSRAYIAYCDAMATLAGQRVIIMR